jgi:hypothetical protein
MAEEVKIILTAEDNISSVIRKVSDHLGESGLGQTLTAVSTSFLAVTEVMEIAAAGFGKVYGVIADGVKDAAEAENVNKRLAMSMATVGQYTEKSFTEIQNWAGALETATGTSDEAFRSTVALGLQMGMTVEQSKKATEAALNLAAATGQDMESAFRQMSMTMSGSAGRLAKMIPELRNLTKEELENGAAIDLISKKYAGFAGNAANSFDGAMKRLDSQIGNVKESFGRIIAQNPAVIAAISKLGDLIGEVAAGMEEFATFILNNSEDLKILAVSFGIASAAVGAYVVYQNAATVATVAAKVATIAFNTVMAATPYGMIIAAVAALTAGLYFLYKNFDLVAGAVKVGLGYALQAVTFQLTMFLTGLAKVVGFFNEDWGKSLENAVSKIEGVSKNLIASGKAQMDAANAAKKGAEEQTTAAMTVQRATEGITNKIKETEQEIIKMNNEFTKSMEHAKTAFSAVKDLMPRMNLENFKEDAAKWTASIADLKTKAEALKVKLSVGVQTEEVAAELEKVNQQLRFAAEAEKAIKIKTAIESRQAILAEEQIRLDQQLARATTTEQQISQMRLEQSAALRSQMIEMETQSLLAQRGLASADAQEGMTAKQAAMLEANNIELSAYKAKLETERSLAVDNELQKQIALAEVKAAAMTEGSAGQAGAQADVEVLKAQARQQELARLRQEDMISEQLYQEQLTQMKIDAITVRTEQEMLLNQQRIAMLGNSPEAQALALENEKMKNEQELLILQEKYAAQLITDEEYRIAKQQAELTHMENSAMMKEQFIQKDIQQNERLGNQWAVTLGKIRLEQQKHGQVMGMIRGIQQSQEYAVMQQGLSDLSSLRSSSDRKAFEAGKAAAIGQAIVNTFMSATSAFAAMASIPIVGPALGAAAAAAAIMAGMNNVAQIKSQKFQGGAHGGIDEVPKSMNNSTFVLKAGERVVQPDQNKELGQAVDKINNGTASGGHTVNLTVGSVTDEGMISRIKDAVIDGIREASERGTPIMSEKGLVRA